MNKKEYLLICLNEELAELQQEISKCLRFTCDNVHKEKQTSNIYTANLEWSQVIAVLELLDDEGICLEHIDKEIESKKIRLNAYIEYSKSIGVIKE